MKKLLVLFALVGLLGGCATSSSIREKITSNQFDEPTVIQPTYLQKNTMNPPQGGPIPVAVYSFTDKTGQRKYVTGYASFSTAVTQGAEGYVIKALQDAGEGRWFRVVERVGLDNLIKERQMIRQMREAYQGKDAQALPPMVFAGVIIEGGIIGYDSNLITGGAGARYLGIGADTQYRKDQVIVSLRAVSTNTGEVLMNVQVSKTVLSVSRDLSLFRFVDVGTKLVEAESGMTQNEANTIAVKTAIEQAVIELIKQGIEKGYWKYQEQK